jgi:PAS domain S-box-containing protein
MIWFMCGGILFAGATLLVLWTWIQSAAVGPAGTSGQPDAVLLVLIAGALLLLTMGVISYLIGGRLSQRLGTLASVAESIMHENPGHKVPVSGNDEISKVSNSLNELSEFMAVTYRELHETADKYRELSSHIAVGDAIKSAMLSTALDAIVTIDEEGIIHDFNTAAEKLFGYARDEAVGEDLAELFIPEAYREAHRQGMAHWKATGEANVFGVRIEIEAQNRSGKIFPIELAITPLGLEGETYFTGFIRDITEQKMAQAELRLAASTFESKEGIFITDAESNIIRVNRALLEMTGFTEDAVIGANPDRIIKPGQVVMASGSDWNDLLSSDDHQYEIYVQPIKGQAYPGWVSISAVRDDEGKVINYVVHVIDMTEQKQIEQDLQSAREEAEAANRAKSQFLANMSHEIRTPLNAIINLNSLLLNSAMSSEQQDLAIAANNGGKALSKLVDDILDFSKIEAGKLRLLNLPFNLHVLIHDLDALFRPQASTDGLVLLVSIGQEVPEWVAGDEIRLRQVLVNLLGNALKFTEVGEVELSVERSNNQSILFRVRDTGIGISPEEAELIFAEFSQADESLTRRHGGTGLGLPISEGFVRKMNGQIHYEPGAEVGSIFWFEIPLEQAEKPEEVEKAIDVDRLLGASVLVAEDSHANQLVAKALLEKAGCRVELVSNGKEAVEAASNNSFDTVFMDLSMPVMDGLEATRLIRAMEGGSSGVPIIAMTANVFSEDRKRCLEAGMNDFVAKPIQEQVLIERLAYWLGSDSSLQDGVKSVDAAVQDFCILDGDVLARMEKETSAELMKQVVGIFIEETQEHLDLLKKAGPDVDPSTLAAEAHAIKSSAGTFGALRLHEVARRVETLAREGRYELAVAATDAIYDIGIETIQHYARSIASDNTGSEEHT